MMDQHAAGPIMATTAVADQPAINNNLRGSHSIKHLKANGLTVRLVPQGAKHRYLYFLDPSWRGRLRVPALPYPRKEA